MSLAQL